MVITTQHVFRLLYLLLFISVISWITAVVFHGTFEEWDGVIQFFAGQHFWETGQYIGWPSHFWPPLQPILLGLGDPIFIGRVIAVLSGVLVLASVYKLAVLRELQPLDVMIVLTLIASNDAFILSHSLIENHALEAGFCLAGIAMVETFLKTENRSRLYLAAALFALGGLTRYTAYAFTLGTFLYLAFRRTPARDLFGFCLVFGVVSCLWWIPNLIMNGSPLATWQFVNVGRAIHPAGESDWLWLHQENFTGLIEVISAFPREFIANYKQNLLESLVYVINGICATLIISFLYCIGYIAVWMFNCRNAKFSRKNIYLWSMAVFYILICCIAFVFQDALWPAVILISVAMFTYLVQFQRIRMLLLLLIMVNVFYTGKAAYTLVTTVSTDGGQLIVPEQIAQKLRADPDIAAKTIVSVHPAYAYYAGSNWAPFPTRNIQTLCDVASYNISAEIGTRLARRPVDAAPVPITVSYIIAGPYIHNTEGLLREDTLQAPCPLNITHMFSVQDVDVYQVTTP